jgi:hypothetical protein
MIPSLGHRSKKSGPTMVCFGAGGRAVPAGRL